jgi:hypothetical protein
MKAKISRIYFINFFFAVWRICFWKLNGFFFVDQVGKIRKQERLKWKLAWNKPFIGDPSSNLIYLLLKSESRSQGIKRKVTFLWTKH